MRRGQTIWVTEDWGIRKDRSRGAGRYYYQVVFTKEMQAASGPFWSSKLQAKKDIWRMLREGGRWVGLPWPGENSLF